MKAKTNESGSPQGPSEIVANIEMQPNSQRKGTPHEVAHDWTPACYAPPRCKKVAAPVSQGPRPCPSALDIQKWSERIAVAAMNSSDSRDRRAREQVTGYVKTQLEYFVAQFFPSAPLKDTDNA